MDIVTIVSLTITLFMILNPFSSLPVFIDITRGLEEREIVSYANKAVLVATILLFFFLFTGEYLLDIFGVTMSSFQVAGGIILLMMAIELVLGDKRHDDCGSSGAKWAVIASPILTGPGMISATIIYSMEYGMAQVMISGALALLFTWLILTMSPKITRFMGEQAIEVLTKIMGLFVAARGIESILTGAVTWFDENGAKALRMP